MLTQKYRILCLAIFISLFAFDQATKVWALASFRQGFYVEVWPILNFTLAFNEGIGLSMFSFLSDWLNSGSQLIFGLVNVIVSGFIVWIFRAEVRLPALVGWSMVVAGALGNALDRFVALFTPRTGVVDFVWLHWEPVCQATGLSMRLCNFPIFNVADCAITFGFAVVLIDMLFFADKAKKDTNDNATANTDEVP